ncbi:ATP-dependent DNA helicase PIF1 [Trichonephila inaurata madagascariensis]|uniref:ATP-dependent DNA helicase PIF1 n=1 Tax=Trichonephila inaurata madagascariensis TaxID=2747483 RepID=A0A8X6WT37_9ARAC|nr:ATP-dependent DNA helicase PIF1 [Trichonephila inaurata madagascariensis]
MYGYASFRRTKAKGGRFSVIFNVRYSEIVADYRWIVLLCTWLSGIFRPQISGEYFNSIKSIKYVCKHINRESDMTLFYRTSSDGNAPNEVNEYEMERYISSNETVWRILNFSIHERYTTVIHYVPSWTESRVLQEVESLKR